MEPIKQLSVLLESSKEAMIHDTLDYFLRLLYDKLERGPKRRVASSSVLNTFVNTFRWKLLTLLDDVEQFFLWVLAAALDGRKTNLELLGSCLGPQGRMAECYRQIQKCMSIAVGGGAEPCRAGETRFVTVLLHPFGMQSPSSNRCFWRRLQILHRKSRGSGSSCSEHEGDGSSGTTVEPSREE